MAEKTLLQQIREKELMLSIRIEDTRRESEELLISARKQAEETVESFEKAGKAAADEYYKSEMEKVNREIARIRAGGNARAGATRDAGEKNVDVAAGLLEKAVFPG